MAKGGCFCGWIRYETAATPFDETNCHCSICRRTSGAPFVAWFSVPRSQFRLVSGEPTRFESTAKATRSFCPRCGTQLTFEHEDFLDEIDVTTSNLDDPEWAPPRDPYEQRAQLGQTVRSITRTSRKSAERVIIARHRHDYLGKPAGISVLRGGLANKIKSEDVNRAQEKIIKDRL